MMEDRTGRSQKPAGNRGDQHGKLVRRESDLRRDAGFEGVKPARAQTGGILREIDEQKHRLD
jgi:hypothetical protein